MKKTLKKISLFAVLVVATIVLTGCGNSNSIIGTWQYKDGDSVKSDVYYKFNKDKTGEYTYYGSTRNFTYEDKGTKVKISYEGTTTPNEFDYSIKDNILTIKDSFGSDVTYKRK